MTRAQVGFPDRDPVGPAPGTGEHPARAAAVDLARRLLVPGSTDADRVGVPRATLDALGRAGLLGLAAGPGPDGSPVPAAVQREVAEVLAGSCGATWFCWTQAHTPLRMLAASGNAALRTELLTGLAEGRLLSAVAFAHLRRPDPGLVATPAGNGWRLTGSLDWVTSWSIADVVLVGAVGAPPHDDTIVWVFLDARSQAGLVAGPPLRLIAMAGTHTCPLRLDAVYVEGPRVVAVVDRAAWLAEDAARARNASALAFGLARAATAQLAAAAEDGAEEARAAGALVEECRALRQRAYALVDDVPPGERLDERAQVRAASLALAVRATSAAVAAAGGAAMAVTSPDGRRAREAAFALVQQQTPPVRDALLARLAGPAGADGR